MIGSDLHIYIYLFSKQYIQHTKKKATMKFIICEPISNFFFILIGRTILLLIHCPQRRIIIIIIIMFVYFDYKCCAISFLLLLLLFSKHRMLNHLISLCNKQNKRIIYWVIFLFFNINYD